VRDEEVRAVIDRNVGAGLDGLMLSEFAGRWVSDPRSAGGRYSLRKTLRIPTTRAIERFLGGDRDFLGADRASSQCWSFAGGSVRFCAGGAIMC
jgi:hypothetical protein